MGGLGALGDFAPEMPLRALKKKGGEKKEPLEIVRDANVKAC